MKGLDKWAPWLPALYQNRDIRALKSLWAGTASPEDQIHAIRYIVKHLCKTHDLSYRAHSQRDTDFAEGKRFVGLQIMKFVNYDPTDMRNENVGPNDGSGGRS